MKAVFLSSKGGSESLVLGDVPQPRPEAGEVLVRVHATAVTPTEFEWFPTWNTPDGKPRSFPIVFSHEFSGEIEALGAGVTTVKAGDVVYGLNDWFSSGAQAEYCVAPASAIALKPKALDYIHSAVAPMSALTAWQGLFKRASLQSGQRVLIHGAAGGVGIFAVQLARWRGAHVIATASSGNLDFVRSLGANEVIDYQKTRFEEVVRGVDAVFDGVGSDTLDRSWGVLAKGGKLVTVASQSENADQRARDAFMLVQAYGSQLTEISNLIDAGELRVFIEDVFPLAKAREAYARAQKGKMHGKIALSVTV
jgi:NADPH:quinone reductase-like Zn-dependent oxidoreductase